MWVINGVTATNTGADTGNPMPLSRMGGVIVDDDRVRAVFGER